MADWLRKFYLNESEGGSPSTSLYDVELSSVPTFPNNQILPFENSGATKGSMTFPGIYGQGAEGLGSIQPTAIPDYFYYGAAPSELQPILDKPKPWEN